MKNLFSAIVVSLFSFTLVYSQVYTPVTWEFSTKKISQTEVDLIFTASIQEGWKLFSCNLDSDMGPVPTSFAFHKTNNYEIIDKVKESENRKAAYSTAFEMNVHWFEKKAVFTHRVKVIKDKPIIGQIEFMVCNKDRCLPPNFQQFKIDLSELGVGVKSEIVFSADPAEPDENPNNKEEN